MQTPAINSETLGLPVIESLGGREPSAEFVERVPIHFARQHGVLGLVGEHGQLPVAIADEKLDGALDALQVVSRFLGKPVQPLVAPARLVAAAINDAYERRTGQAQNLVHSIESSSDSGAADVDAARQHSAEWERLRAARDDLLDVAGRAPTIRLVNLVLFEAVQARASDVHLQPYEDALVVRMRIDGVLHDSLKLPKRLQEELISRIKVMGRMNIAEKRLPQDGRATVQVGDRAIDLRIATLPTSFGERVVVRLLDKSSRLYNLAELGMAPQPLVQFRRLISADHGLILVTGPTGSGKTTTLYAALQEINHRELNILTLEDPIEYQLAGISQTQVSEKKGMTFASGLRSVLRQDPDIIMIGEIRDRETAVMAIQSALTGHLVFSTLHTNDAAGAVARLLDLGIEPYLLASSLVGVVAQRLLRRVCSDCSRPAPADDLARLFPAGAASSSSSSSSPSSADADRIVTTRGCAACRQTGYRGRLGIFELLLVDDAVRKQIHATATAAEINAAAREDGMTSLREDGIAKVKGGVTTVDEVLRVTMRASL
jgi:general secretion pathway protein E